MMGTQMAKNEHLSKQAEDLVRSVLTKIFNQTIDDESVKATAEKLATAVRSPKPHAVQRHREAA